MNIYFVHTILTLFFKQVSFKTDFNSKKRKASESEDEKLKIYRIEDIPRTKKMQKIEKKKRLKKARKNGLHKLSIHFFNKI